MKRQLFSLSFPIFITLLFTVVSAHAAPRDEAGVIYDRTDPDLARTAAKAKNAKGVTSVQEAAAAANNLSAELNTKLKVLILAGHGAPGLIGLGSGTSGSYQQGKDLQYDKLDDVRSELEHLKNSLGSDSYVVLVGCETGKGADGIKLVEQLSKKLSATVLANTECVKLADGVTLKPGLICAVVDKTLWQAGTTIGAKNGTKIEIDRELSKNLHKYTCVPKRSGALDESQTNPTPEEPKPEPKPSICYSAPNNPNGPTPCTKPI